MKKSFLMFSGLLFSVTAFCHEPTEPPQLWSWFKDLPKSKEACEIQSSFILDKLQVENKVENEYGIYSNVRNNKVVVKCVEMGDNHSKLWVAVAGMDKDAVEEIRNTVIREIN